MQLIKEQFKELVSLTRDFIQQEYPLLFRRNDHSLLVETKPLPIPDNKKSNEEKIEVKASLPVLLNYPKKDHSVLEEKGQEEFEVTAKKIILEPYKMVHEDSLEDIRKVMMTLFPDKVFIKPAEKRVVFITEGESFLEKQFLENLVKALIAHEIEAEILPLSDVEKRGDVQLVVMCETKKVAPSLPLFFISKLSHYIKDPALKKGLWRGLCNQLGLLNIS